MIENAVYCLTVPNQQLLVDQAEKAFDLVWRFDISAPGFAILDIGPGVDSHILRSVSAEAGAGSFTNRWPDSTSRKRRSSTWTELPNSRC
jgi:hypothetical protein